MVKPQEQYRHRCYRQIRPHTCVAPPWAAPASSSGQDWEWAACKHILVGISENRRMKEAIFRWVQYEEKGKKWTGSVHQTELTIELLKRTGKSSTAQVAAITLSHSARKSRDPYVWKCSTMDQVNEREKMIGREEGGGKRKKKSHLFLADLPWPVNENRTYLRLLLMQIFMRSHTYKHTYIYTWMDTYTHVQVIYICTPTLTFAPQSKQFPASREAARLRCRWSHGILSRRSSHLFTIAKESRERERIGTEKRREIEEEGGEWDREQRGDKNMRWKGSKKKDTWADIDKTQSRPYWGKNWRASLFSLRLIARYMSTKWNSLRHYSQNVE